MENKENLAELWIGETAVIKKLVAGDHIRRRLLDMGFVEGTRIKCIGSSPSGNPRAFLVKGAVIAIRLEDCRHILTEEDSYEKEE